VFTFGDFIFIEFNNVYIKANIIMVQDDSMLGGTAIVGTNTYIEPGLLTIYSSSLNESQIVNILNNYYPYYKGTILEQVDNTTYKILLPLNSMYQYDSIMNTTTNKVIITFRYSEIDLINNSYPLVGFNKVPDTITTTTTTNKSYHDIEWIKNMGIYMFKSIELLIDDNTIEKIDSDIIKIIIYYFLNMFRRQESLKIITVIKNPDGSSYFNLILPFYFTAHESQYMPVSLMSRSNIKIKFILNKLSSLISNWKSNYSYSSIINPTIDFNYAFMTMDNDTLKKICNINIKGISEILISPMYYYQNFLLNKLEEYNHISLMNRTRELFFITKNNNNLTNTNNVNYIETPSYDSWYSEYLSNNINNEYIYNLIDAEIDANSQRYNILKDHSIIGKYSTRFAMFLDSKYLVYINENLNNVSLKYSYKLTVLSLYFTNNYVNEIIYTPVNIIDTLNIMINGKELLPNLPSQYHNYVIPYMKGYMLPDGFHTYGFGYNSLTLQPNGMLNMKKIKDFLIYSKQLDVNKEYKLKICTKEYKILKIDMNTMRGNIV
jgi:hypothetical protein